MRLPSTISAAISLLLWPQPITASRPFYAIAHRVTNLVGLEAAYRDGATAIEISVSPWPISGGWFADPDGTLSSKESPLLNLLDHISKKAREGPRFFFVWLDIRWPNYCSDGCSASIEALRYLVRKHLQKHDIRVLYGFDTQETGRAYEVLSNSLNHNEAIGLDGPFEEAKAIVEAKGPSNPEQRVYSTGSPTWNLISVDELDKILRDLRLARESRLFRTIFSWTLHWGLRPGRVERYIERFMQDGKVDGLIYGRPSEVYAVNSTMRLTVEWIYEKISYAEFCRFPNNNDKPFIKESSPEVEVELKNAISSLRCES
ncbi:hypothetical protein CP533_6661 [Ophiocordyceps camponoti-saundersi (nom. inval.)]|nr:hypothetical protein CP533_6661 [Ophiocordyceps camponoti-saundersi (nom. inval.)]